MEPVTKQTLMDHARLTGMVRGGTWDYAIPQAAMDFIMELAEDDEVNASDFVWLYRTDEIHGKLYPITRRGRKFVDEHTGELELKVGVHPTGISVEEAYVPLALERLTNRIHEDLMDAEITDGGHVTTQVLSKVLVAMYAELSENYYIHSG